MSRTCGRLIPRVLLLCSALLLSLAVFAVRAEACGCEDDRGHGSSSHHEYDWDHYYGSWHHGGDDDRDCDAQSKCGGIKVTGAIYTTNATGQAVNRNRYTSAKDVFLIGGPQVGKTKNRLKDGRAYDHHKPWGWNDHSIQSAALPDGWYYFQVTDPSGKVLLTTDDISRRQVYVEDGVIAAAYGRVSLRTSAGLIVQLSPFDKTPNRGKEYKVWMTPQSSYEAAGGFAPACSKTDNFKVISYAGGGGGGGNLTATLKGTIFEDGITTGTPGQKDATEPGIPNVSVDLFLQGEAAPLKTGTTGTDGTFTFTEQPPALGTAYLLAPRLIETGRGPLTYGPMTPAVREATVTTNGQVIGQQDFGLVKIAPETLVLLGGSGGNINFTPEYFTGSSSNQGSYVLEAYFAQTTKLPAFLTEPAAILKNAACGPSDGTPQGPIDSAEDVIDFLNRNAFSADPICQAAGLWLSLSLGIATNGTYGVDSAGNLQGIDPATGAIDYGIVHSISGGETFCWDCPASKPKVLGAEQIFGSVNTLLQEVAACTASNFASPCDPIGSYLNALRQASHGYLGSVFLQSVDHPSGGF